MLVHDYVWYLSKAQNITSLLFFLPNVRDIKKLKVNYKYPCGSHRVVYISCKGVWNVVVIPFYTYSLKKNGNN